MDIDRDLKSFTPNQVQSSVNIMNKVLSKSVKSSIQIRFKVLSKSGTKFYPNQVQSSIPIRYKVLSQSGTKFYPNQVQSFIQKSTNLLFAVGFHQLLPGCRSNRLSAICVWVLREKIREKDPGCATGLDRTLGRTMYKHCPV